MGTVIDAVIIGKLIGVDALLAVTLSNLSYKSVYSWKILELDGATVAAVWLGECKIKETSKIFSACIVGGIIFTVIMGLSAFWISEPPANILAADAPYLAKPIEDYIFINILGLPIISLTVLICEFIIVDNNPDLGAWIFGIAAVVNIIMDRNIIPECRRLSEDSTRIIDSEHLIKLYKLINENIYGRVGIFQIL